MKKKPKIRLTVHPLTLPVWGAFCLLLGVQAVGASLLASLFHELGHLLAMGLCRLPLASLTLSPVGLTILPDGAPCTRPSAAWIAASGPMANLLCGTAAYLLLLRLPQPPPLFLIRFFLSSLLLALLNLLPHPRLDGGSLARLLLSLLLPLQRAEKALALLGDLAMLLLLSFLLYPIFYGWVSVSPILLAASLLLSLIEENRGEKRDGL